MNHHSSSNGSQLGLNLYQRETILASQLTTKEVREFLRILTKTDLSSQEIRSKGKIDPLKVSYIYGNLKILRSLSKNSRFWRWNIIFVPSSLGNLST